MIKELSPRIVRKIWGGKKLEEMKGLSTDQFLEPIGETLEIYSSDLPYLAKFIDTSDELSIQVHPGDEYARLHENSSGKTECWIILEAAIDAGIYLGLKPHASKELLELYLRDKKPLNELLNYYPIKRGDFFFVPAGSIHAIGRNITLAEVQQNSGITYRVWDWERLDDSGKSRELHVEQSLDVINFNPLENELAFFKHQKNLFSKDGCFEVCTHPDFHLFLLNQKSGDTYTQALNLNRPCSILNLEGSITINKKSVKSFDAVRIENEESLSIKAMEDGSLLIIF